MTGASTATHALARFRAEFPVFERQIYLNTCSLGALARRSRERVEAFLEAWDRRGAAAWYDVWWEDLAELRSSYAAVVGARPEEIALHASVSTATGVLASALDYAARPKVVTTSLDFPTVTYQWLAKRPLGVQVEVIQSPDAVSVPLEAFARAVDDRTALVATSHVYFTSGAIQDVRALSDLAHARGALCFVDGYQSVGQIPVKVHDLGVDFLTAGGLKWLLGGPGIVFLYVREDVGRRLVPTTTGWFANEHQFAFDAARMDWHQDARRFEQGTPALASVYAQLGGLELLREIGWPEIFAVTRELTADLVSLAKERGLNPRISPDPGARSAIVMIPSADPPAAVRRLAAAGIVADARPGHVRLSPFFYNIRDDYVAAIETLASP